MSSDYESSRHIFASEVRRRLVSFRTEQLAERKRPPADVFVSYSSPDREQARAICMKLDKAKVAYFLDEKEMKPGDEISSRLAQEIKQRKHYLLLLSRHSVASPWVTSEWTFAWASERDCRILRLANDVSIPPQLGRFVVYDESEGLVEYYRAQKYDQLSVHIFLRDLLWPVRLEELRNFEPVADQPSAWEHQDVMKWPDEDRKRFNDGYGRSLRIARIQIERTDGSPKLQLRCWRGGPVDQEIEPNGGKLTLYRWWDIPEKASEEEVVHPAFWCEAMEELVRLLERETSVLQRSGIDIRNLPPVTW